MTCGPLYSNTTDEHSGVEILGEAGRGNGIGTVYIDGG